MPTGVLDVPGAADPDAVLGEADWNRRATAGAGGDASARCQPYRQHASLAVAGKMAHDAITKQGLDYNGVVNELKHLFGATDPPTGR